MIAYLLHKLPDSEREAFEDRWMEDSGLYNELQDVEAELLDDYASGALTPEDRDLVTRHLLGDPAQDQKLLFARTYGFCGQRLPGWRLCCGDPIRRH